MSQLEYKYNKYRELSERNPNNAIYRLKVSQYLYKMNGGKPNRWKEIDCEKEYPESFLTKAFDTVTFNAFKQSKEEFIKSCNACKENEVAFCKKDLCVNNSELCGQCEICDENFKIINANRKK